MASFIMASTAFGVCSQSGIVKTALAFAAAVRKSSTVFVSAAGRLGLVTAKTNDKKRNEDFIVVEVGSHLYARAAAKSNSAETSSARWRGGGHHRLSIGHR